MHSKLFQIYITTMRLSINLLNFSVNKEFSCQT
nr:MAG TPA: hypothetical protein [Caudoviricetes sp.]